MADIPTSVLHARVVLDANVLYSETLTDVFIALAAADLLAVVWSDRLREEWDLALSRNRAEVDAIWTASRSRQLQSAQNWAIITIDMALTETLVLPDQDDRHVLAAAIQSGATAIVTSNLRDFPRRTLAIHGVSAVPADEVVLQMIKNSRDRVVVALRPAHADIEGYLETLRRAGLARSVKALLACPKV